MAMADLVEEVLVAKLVDQGFSRVSIFYGDPQNRVLGREIHLELTEGTDTLSVTFNFDKWRLPRFQVHLARRSKRDQIVWSANLVRKSTQFYHFWGKPFWWPSRLWSQRKTKLVVRDVEARLPEAINFLERGKRSSPISPALDIAQNP